MCTLTVIPFSGGLIVTHNRDEHEQREPAELPHTHLIRGKRIFFPRDGRAGGTWIAASEGRAACILNGAFVRHNHLPPYRKSRGLVLIDSFFYQDTAEFTGAYSFENIEPFTMVSVQTGGIVEIMRWDGEKPYLILQNALPVIQSSATLYDPTIAEKRHSVIADFISRITTPEAEKILDFHLNGEMGDEENNMIIKRKNGVKTLSVTQLVLSRGNISATYSDLINGSTHYYPTID